MIFVIRTQRTPFTRSRASTPLLVSVFAAVLVGVVLPFIPLAADLGFSPPPLALLAPSWRWSWCT